MKTQIIKIGNSHAIRIPKLLLDQLRFEGEVDIRVTENTLVIAAPSKPRAGWAEAFTKMARLG